MVLNFIFNSFLAGSILFKVGLVVFILFFSILLTWGVFAIFNLEQLRLNKEELFQIVTKEEISKFEILAEYKVFGTSDYVYFLDKGIAISDELNLKLILYLDIEISKFILELKRFLKFKEYPKYFKIPLKTPKKLKIIYGGQSLKVFLPNEDNKKRIIFENLIGILE